MKSIFTWIIIIILIAGAIFFLTSNKTEENGTPNEAESAMIDNHDGDNVTSDTSTSTTITYTKDGFSPKDVEIAKGEAVTFVNDSTGKMWPASAKHPTHTVYPGSDIEKCEADGDKGILFDACKGIESGESWSFIFNETGKWFYHDHIKSSNFGSVTVK